MTSIRRALAFALAERYVLIALSLGSSIALARLLTPEQIGIYSVSLAVISVAQVLRDFGVGNYLIQERDLTESHVRTAFGTSLALGLLLFGVVWAAAPAVSAFYQELRMTATIRICAFNFLVLPFSTVTLALLRRNMQFKRLAAINVCATATGVGGTLGCALAGLGQESLAIGSVVTNLGMVIGGAIALPERRLVVPSMTEWRSVLRFGSQSSLSGVVTSVSMDANDLVVAKILGFHDVALLSRAQGLMNILHRDVMTAVRGVALPAFAAAHRRQEDLEAQHVRSVALTTVFAWPAYGLIATYALEALRLLYGLQWDAARPAVAVFCLAGAVSSLCSLAPTLLIAVGRIDLMTRFDLTMQPLRLLLIIGAAWWFKSIVACAVALLLISVLSLPVFAWLKARAFPTDWSQWVAQVGRSALVAIASLLPALLHGWVIGFDRETPASLLIVIPVSLLCAAFWLAAVFAVRHPVIQEPVFQSTWRRLAKWRPV